MLQYRIPEFIWLENWVAVVGTLRFVLKLGFQSVAVISNSPNVLGEFAAKLLANQSPIHACG